MLEFDMVECVAGRMATSMYKMLKIDHDHAVNECLTEAGADEAARMAIEKLYHCSYMLTNLSLDESAKKYTNVRKRSGDLDYNKIRGITTPLTEAELGYCEYDILTLYAIIKKFREKYGHIKSIPLTQTGEVRKAINNEVDYYYHVKQWELVPSARCYERGGQWKLIIIL